MFNAPSATNLITALQTFHTSLQGVPPASSTPNVLAGLCQVSYKGTGVGPSDLPQITNANRVRIGLVPDTQRRRRNALPESYEFADLTVPV
jgi:hypothetical protein